jgi:hypothetical protein
MSNNPRVLDLTRKIEYKGVALRRAEEIGDLATAHRLMREIVSHGKEALAIIAKGEER